MKKYLLSLLLLIPTLAFGESNIWEKAAYGSLPGVSLVNLFGVDPAINTSLELAWEESAAYTPLTAAFSSPYCASSSANDASAGTGARTVSVKGINTSFAAFSETVTMNGTTSVVLVTTNILMINSITVLTAGSGLVNAGIVQCGTGTNTSGDPAVPHAYLPVSSASAIAAAGVGGANESKTFMYGVPANKTLICRNITTGYYLVTTANGVQMAIDGYTNSTGVLKRYFSSATNNAGGNPIMNPTIIRFPEKTIVLGKMAASGAGVGFMSAQCLLIDDGRVNLNQKFF